MFQRHLGAFALVAALVAPLAASAQTAPAPAAPAVAPGAYGAGPHHRRHHHHRRNGFMHAMRGLNLSDDQKQKLAAIFKSARTQHQQMATAGTKPDPAARKANMVAMRQQIDSILTDTQRAKLADNLKHEHHKRDWQSRPAQSPPQ